VVKHKASVVVNRNSLVFVIHGGAT